MGFGIFDIHVFEVVFSLVFILVMGMFVVSLVQGIATWNKNNHSPRLCVTATVVSKRTNFSRHANAGDVTGVHGHHTSTSYYVTFQVESGDRMEFQVSGSEYSMLVEGDAGKLSFQGTRYGSFERF